MKLRNVTRKRFKIGNILFKSNRDYTVTMAFLEKYKDIIHKFHSEHKLVVRVFPLAANSINVFNDIIYGPAKKKPTTPKTLKVSEKVEEVDTKSVSDKVDKVESETKSDKADESEKVVEPIKVTDTPKKKSRSHKKKSTKATKTSNEKK